MDKFYQKYKEKKKQKATKIIHAKNDEININDNDKKMGALSDALPFSY